MKINYFYNYQFPIINSQLLKRILQSLDYQSKMQTFSEVLAYLYARLPMFTRIGAAALKPDLHNTLALCEALGNPQHQFKSIHIAGTNGKGSTSSMLSAILQAANYKVGLYTSPHLKSFTERVRINGVEMPEKKVIDFVNEHKALIESLEPSFFEVVTAMAFGYFAEEKVDIAIIEVGLGGRLDCTNVIMPELCVITNISYDHTDLLGDTLAQIASEKAGIIKQNIPVIIGEETKETKTVFIEKAKKENAKIYFAGESRSAEIKSSKLKYQLIEVTHFQGDKTFKNVYELDLTGNYQAKNIVAVLQAVELLQNQGWEIEQEDVEYGLKQVGKITGLKGRMFLLQENPNVICDVGHNEAGVKYVMEQLNELKMKQLHIVWGMVKDKNHAKVLALLPQNAHYYFVCPNIPRGLAVAEMQAKAAEFGLVGDAYPSVNEGLNAALQKVNAENELVFVGGSTFVVAEVV